MLLALLWCTRRGDPLAPEYASLLRVGFFLGVLCDEKSYLHLICAVIYLLMSEITDVRSYTQYVRSSYQEAVMVQENSSNAMQGIGASLKSWRAMGGLYSDRKSVV